MLITSFDTFPIGVKEKVEENITTEHKLCWCCLPSELHGLVRAQAKVFDSVSVSKAHCACHVVNNLMNALDDDICLGMQIGG